MVHVIFGRDTGFGTVDLADLDPADGFSIQGEAAGDRLGLQVAGAGDVNADGYGDLILGAFDEFERRGCRRGLSDLRKGGGLRADRPCRSRRGRRREDRRRAPPGTPPASAPPAPGTSTATASTIWWWARSSPTAAAWIRARPTVVFGRAAGLAGVDLADLAPADGFRLDGGSDYDHAGASVAGAGDLNGDGFGDLLVGAPDDGTGGSNAGAAYVVFGAPTPGGPPPGPPGVDLNGAAAGRDFAGFYLENGAGAAIGAAIIVTAPGGPIARVAIAIVDAVAGDKLSIGGDAARGDRRRSAAARC